MNKRYLAIFFIFFMLSGCNSTDTNFNSLSSTQSVISETENVASNGTSFVASSGTHMEETDRDSLVSSADDTPNSLKSECNTIKAETVAQDVMKLDFPNEITGLWFPNETHVIIQDTEKLYLYDVSNNTTEKIQEIQSYGVPLVCGDVLMLRNETELVDFDIHTLEIIQRLELKDKPFIGRYSPDKKFYIRASGGKVDITNTETQQLKHMRVGNDGDLGHFDVTWVEGFPEEDKVIYNSTNELAGKNKIGVIGLSDSFARLYQMKESAVDLANGKAIISSLNYADKEAGERYLYRLEAPAYELTETRIPDFGKFAISINGNFIVNLTDKSYYDKAIKSGTTIKIFDGDNDQLVSSKFFDCETEIQTIEVSSDGKTVAASSYDDAKSVYIYSIA